MKAPNLRSVLSPLFGEGINKLVSFENYLGLLLTAGFSFWLCLRQRAADNQRSIALFYIFTFSLMTVLQHNAISNYAYLFMLPLALLVMPLTNNRAWIALIGFNVLAAMHPSFWWRIGMPFYYSLTDLNQARYLLDYAIEVLLVGGFAYIAYRSAQYLRSANVSPILERSDNPKTTGATI